MNIYTYYQSLHPHKHSENMWLLDVWKKSWSYHGWTPVVLTLDDAKSHPMYEHFYKQCDKYPTINAKEYEMACYVRWLAMTSRSGWTTDYDVINYGFKPTNYNDDVVSLTGAMGGSTIYATKTFYEHIVNVIMNYKFDKNINVITLYDKQHVHVSDMTIMNLCLSPTKIILLEKCYGSDGYDNSPLVHYNNYNVSQKNTNRKNAILTDLRSSKFIYE